ncbi:ABC transporter permease, partial [Chloroflexota bacterium]
HALGLDVPIYVQYGRWWGVVPQADGSLSGIIQGDLGRSLWEKTEVADEIAARIPVTAVLLAMAILVAVIISFPVAILSAVRQDSIGDYIGRTIAILCMAVPSFWLGTMVMVFPALWWEWSPPIRFVPFTENPLASLQQLIIPAVIVGFTIAGINMRFLRTAMLNVLRQDYVRTAWSKGLRERVVILRHVLKNALIPVTTVWGIQIAYMIGGSIIVEKIFALPGLGRLIVDATFDRDYTIVSGVMITLAVIVMFINVFIDITYSWLDPRIRFK